MENEINNQKKIRIVVIDSGIDSGDAFLSGSIKDEVGYSFTNNRGIIEERKPKIADNHGTLIAKTIKFICSNVEFVSINILNKNLKADGQLLIKALQRAWDFKPEIVHISLGIANFMYLKPLKKIITEFNKSNILVVAAVNDEGLLSYPANFSDVVGVRGINSKRNALFYYGDNFFYSSLFLPSLFCQSNKEYGNIRSNSIAAAYITGHISNSMLQQNTRDIKSMLENLKSKSMNSLERLSE